MAYVVVTTRGGAEADRDRVRDVLVSRFEGAWGEIVVELTFDAAYWRVDRALWKVAGAAIPLDCRAQVATALSVAHIANFAPLDPTSPFRDMPSTLW